MPGTERRQNQINLTNELSEMKVDIKYIQRDLGEIKTSLKENNDKFVTQDEFEPIRKIVYGLVGLILTGVVGALLTLIIRQ
jgi:hypothetical protein